MLININIEDQVLQKQIANYITNKHKQVNHLMVEALEHFFKKDHTLLNYKTQDAEKNAQIIDFNLDVEKNNQKLFQDIDDVETYAKELRTDAWK